MVKLKAEHRSNGKVERIFKLTKTKLKIMQSLSGFE